MYTELATNQVISHKDNSTEAKSRIHQFTESQNTNHLSKRKNRFEGFKVEYYSRKDAQSMRINANQDHEGEEGFGGCQVETRPVRTAELTERRQLNSSRRPKTSDRTGRITTVNENLVLTLLE